MSDFDWPQINACIDVYQASLETYRRDLEAYRWDFILLCWWHVLHAWQKHFHITSHPELWDLLKRWIRMTDLNEFNTAWAKIQAMAPTKFVKYLNSYWMSPQVVKMWSAVYRKDRSIFELCDTNMLVEAYVKTSISLLISC
jgi:hypothetical protein